VTEGRGLFDKSTVYTDLNYQEETPLDYQYTLNLKKMKGRGKNKSYQGMGTSGREVGTRKGGMRMNMVDVLCIYI
jgi:hypothetical protein